jgi:hypothetical protein
MESSLALFLTSPPISRCNSQFVPFSPASDIASADNVRKKSLFFRARVNQLTKSLRPILTVREEQRNKLEEMASSENRSVSNLIEVMADERWARLAEQQGIAYAKTVADAVDLKLDMDNPADREKLRRAVLDLVARRNRI